MQEAFRERGSTPFDAWLLALAGVLDLSARIDDPRFPNPGLAHRMAHAIRPERRHRERPWRRFWAIGAPSSHLHQGEILLELGRDREAVEAIQRYRRSLGASSSMRDDLLTWWNYPRALHLQAHRPGEARRDRIVTNRE